MTATASPDPMTRDETLDLVAGLLRGDTPAPEQWARVPAHEFWDLAAQHGVQPLVSDSLARLPGVPAAVRVEAMRRSHQHLAIDLERELAVRLMLERLASAGVPALIFKGAQLAYTHYRRPDLRPRVDTDLLIPDTARDKAHAALTSLGYEGDIAASSDLVMSQRSYTRAMSGQLTHIIDVHWRLANPQVFRDLLSFDELVAGARPIAPLGESARGVADVHALLIACVHRVAHHFDDARLIWLYDLHLIGSALDREAWHRFASLAVERRMAAVCRAGLRHSASRFGTAVPDSVWRALDADGDDRREASATYLDAPRPQIRVLTGDLKALPSWSDRWRLMRQYAFPPADYMRAVYAPASRRPIAWLYARRLLFGARKWLRQPEAR